MEVDPGVVGRVARRWDEQHLDLAAAGHRIGAVSGRGFAPSLVGTATRFATEWARAAAAMGEACESRADSMRTSVRLALEADGVAGAGLHEILAAIAEQR